MTITETLDQKLALQASNDPRAALSERERDARHDLAAQLSRDIVALRSHPQDIAHIDARLAPLRAAHARLTKAEQALLAAPPSPDVTDALATLRRGARRVADVAIFPAPLRALLTDTCPTCHSDTFTWPGTLDALAAQIADLEQRRDYYQRHLTAALTPRELAVTS